MQRQESVISAVDPGLDGNPIDQDDCWKVIDSYFK